MSRWEPLRRCTSCGHLAYRFTPCHYCTLLAAAHDRR